jgi:D-xylulose kinase
MPADQLFIGIDSGTQGTKAIVLSRERGELPAVGYAPHALIENNEGRREQEPQGWIDAATEAVAVALRIAGASPRDVRAIGVSGQQHGMVALDRDGMVIRPAKLWCDTETAPQCLTIERAMGGRERVIEAIGNAVAAGFTASKVRWLIENEPENYDRLDRVLLPHDYLNFWLTGETKTECGDASGTAYFDVRNRRWCDAALRAIDETGRLADRLPELIESDEPVGLIRPGIAELFGFDRDVFVASGGGDNMMAAIGTGNVAPGVVTASLGTSGTIFAYADSPVVDPDGELAAFCSSSGGWLPLVCTMNVTVATEAVRDLLDCDIETFNALAGAARPGADGVTMIPYFQGERTPALPRARASLHGLTASNFTRENLCRAAMEGATFGLRYALDVLRRRGVEPREIRLVGGGARSELWRRMAAAAFDCDVVRPRSLESAALGAAIQAAWCWLKQKEGGESLAALTDRYAPIDESARINRDSESAAEYSKLYDRHLAFESAMRRVNEGSTHAPAPKGDRFH